MVVGVGVAVGVGVGGGKGTAVGVGVGLSGGPLLLVCCIGSCLGGLENGLSVAWIHLAQRVSVSEGMAGVVGLGGQRGGCCKIGSSEPPQAAMLGGCEPPLQGRGGLGE